MIAARVEVAGQHDRYAAGRALRPHPDRLEPGLPVRHTARVRRRVRVHGEHSDRPVRGRHPRRRLVQVAAALGQHDTVERGEQVSGADHRAVRPGARLTDLVRQQRVEPGGQQGLAGQRSELEQHEHIDLLRPHQRQQLPGITLAELQIAAQHDQSAAAGGDTSPGPAAGHGDEQHERRRHRPDPAHPPAAQQHGRDRGGEHRDPGGRHDRLHDRHRPPWQIHPPGGPPEDREAQHQAHQATEPAAARTRPGLPRQGVARHHPIIGCGHPQGCAEIVWTTW